MFNRYTTGPSQNLDGYMDFAHSKSLSRSVHCCQAKAEYSMFMGAIFSEKRLLGRGVDKSEINAKIVT